MLRKCVLLVCAFLISGCSSEEVPTYTAAVVELNPPSYGETVESVAEITQQVNDLFQSTDLNRVDILVLPEGIFNRQDTSFHLTNTNLSYCDDPAAHYVLRNMSCAARKLRLYLVIDFYAEINCSDDDQKFCSNQINSTNLYNMAMVFNRNGEVIAKYRKYHLFNEIGVQQTEKPDLITFRTDFNVTFGVCICFDLMFDEPVINLVERGVKNFVYPTMWFSEIPYLTATQYQQSWAYANNVNLLAANVNSPVLRCSGSGIYSGRSGALKVFVSETPKTEILISKVPVNLPSDGLPKFVSIPKNINETHETSSTSEPKDDQHENYFEKITTKIFGHSKRNSTEELLGAMNLGQDDLEQFSVKFLNFTTNSSQIGTVCSNYICCNYHIEVEDNGLVKGKSIYSYAVSVFSGQRHYKTIKNIRTGQEVCSLIACTEMGLKNSCGIRIPMEVVQNRYNFTKLSLETVLPVTYMKIMPNTVTNDLLPLTVKEFEYKISKVKGADKYVVGLNLIVPKSNLLTFAIFSRDFDKDEITNSARSNKGVIIFILSTLSSLIWLRYGK